MELNNPDNLSNPDLPNSDLTNPNNPNFLNPDMPTTSPYLLLLNYIFYFCIIYSIY
jgi:hypothetical protein